MDDLNALVERLLAAEQAMATWMAATDVVWQRLRAEHTARTGNGLSFLKDLRAMTEQAHAEARAAGHVDPTDDALTALVAAAEAWLAGTPEDRLRLEDLLEACPKLVWLHTGVIGRSARHLRAGDGVEWLRLGLAAAALARGGTDFRDVHVALSDLAGAARAAGLDLRPAFEEVAMACGVRAAPGGLRGSMREFLSGFAA